MTSLETKVKYVCKSDMQNYIKRLKAIMVHMPEEIKTLSNIVSSYRDDLPIDSKYKMVATICLMLVSYGKYDIQMLIDLIMALDHNNDYLTILMLSRICNIGIWTKTMFRCRAKFIMNLFTHKTVPFIFEDSVINSINSSANECIWNYYVTMLMVYDQRDTKRPVGTTGEISNMLASHPMKSKMYYREFIELVIKAIGSKDIFSKEEFGPIEAQKIVGPVGNLVQITNGKKKLIYEYNLFTKEFTKDSLIKAQPDAKLGEYISLHVRISGPNAIWHPFVYEQIIELKEETKLSDYTISYDIFPYLLERSKATDAIIPAKPLDSLLEFSKKSGEEPKLTMFITCMNMFQRNIIIDLKLLVNLVMLLDRLKDYTSIISIYRYSYIRVLWDNAISICRKKYNMSMFKELSFKLDFDSSMVAWGRSLKGNKLGVLSSMSDITSQFYNNSRDKYKETVNYPELYDRIPLKSAGGVSIMHFPDFVKLIIEQLELGEQKDAQFLMQPAEGLIQIFKRKKKPLYEYEYDISLMSPTANSKVQAPLPAKLLSILKRHIQAAKYEAVVWCPYVYTVCKACGVLASKLCGGCLQAYYCSAECQKKDYKTHKKACKTPDPAK